MGLDNGIILQCKDHSTVDTFPSVLDDYCMKQAKISGDIEVAYWRKFWGLRSEILNVINGGIESEGGHYILSIKDCEMIYWVLKRFINKEQYNNYARSIWSYSEALPNLLDQLVNIKWLINHLNNHPEDSAYFYDSY